MLCIHESPPERLPNWPKVRGTFWAALNTNDPSTPIVYLYIHAETIEEYWRGYEINRKLAIIQLFELAKQHGLVKE